MLFPIVVLGFLMKLVSCSNLTVAVCGFPENTSRCKPSDLPCIDNLDISEKFFFNSPTARNLILPKVDTLVLDTFEFYVRQFKITMKDVKIKGNLDSRVHHEASKIPGASVEGYVRHTGSLEAKSVVVDNVEKNIELSVTKDITISFNEILMRAILSFTPRKRCDGNIYFQIDIIDLIYVKNYDTATYVCSGFKQLLREVDYDEFIDALNTQIGTAVNGNSLTAVKLLHVSQPAKNLWLIPDDITLDIPLGGNN